VSVWFPPGMDPTQRTWTPTPSAHTTSRTQGLRDGCRQ
jgi:hypothetical protein